jgi:hypothetical protein
MLIEGGENAFWSPNCHFLSKQTLLPRASTSFITHPSKRKITKSSFKAVLHSSAAQGNVIELVVNLYSHSIPSHLHLSARPDSYVSICTKEILLTAIELLWINGLFNLAKTRIFHTHQAILWEHLLSLQYGPAYERWDSYGFLFGWFVFSFWKPLELQSRCSTAWTTLPVHFALVILEMG